MTTEDKEETGIGQFAATVHYTVRKRENTEKEPDMTPRNPLVMTILNVTEYCHW